MKRIKHNPQAASERKPASCGGVWEGGPGGLKHRLKKN